MSRRNLTARVRALAGCLTAALLIGACSGSSSDDSANDDRDRNVDIVLGGFGDKATGIARTRIGDISVRLPQTAQSRKQVDGTWLVMIQTTKVSTNGFESGFSVSRVKSDGTFDDTFGTDGVVTIDVPTINSVEGRLTQYGQLLVLTRDSEQIDDETKRIRPSRIQRYSAITGQLDAGFANGALVFDDDIRESTVYSFDGGKGDTVVLLTKPVASSTDYTLTQFVNGERNRLFGGMLGGVGGGFVVPVPHPEFSQIVNGYVNLENDGTITTLFTLAETACPANNTTPGCERIPVRRGIGVRQFGLDGSPIIQLAEEANDGIVWIDAEGDSDGVSIGGFQLLEVNRDDADQDQRVLTISFAKDVRRIYRINSSYSRFDANALVTPNGVNIDSVRNASHAGSGSPIVTYLPLAVPLVVGALGDPSPGGSFFWSSPLPVSAATYGPRFGNYPYSFMTASDLQPLTSGTFVNVSTIGLSLFTSTPALENLWSGRGYVKFDAAGKPNALFSGANAMTPSPLNGKNPFAGDLMLNTHLLAGDGDYFYTAAVRTTQQGEQSLEFQRYNAAGGAGASPDGQPTSVSTGDIRPLVFGSKWIVADGKGNAYFRAIRGNDVVRVGLAKVDLSKGRIDRGYGDNGFATLGSDEPGVDDFAQSWWAASLQANSDGSVDAISADWKVQGSDELPPTIIRTRRVPPNGKTDESTRTITVVTDPKETGCACFEIMPPTTVMSIIVDSEQRVVIARIDTAEIGPGEANYDAVVKMIRYTTDGSIDTSFGSEGGVKISGLTGLIELPPLIVSRGNGEYLLGYASVDATTGKGGAPVVDGQYMNLVRIGSSGKALDFTPPAPNPVADRVADLINSIPSQNSSAGALAALPVADQPAVAAAEQMGLAATLPTNIALVTPDNTVRITLAASVADRAVDVRWSIPAALAGTSAKYTVTGTPGGQKCVTASTSCVFKKLDPWTAYSFVVKTVSASSGGPSDSLASLPVKPVRVLARKTSVATAKLITAASSGKQTWKVKGGCALSKDTTSLTTTKDAGVCTLSLTTAKAGKVPKTTRSITIVVRAVAK